MCVIIILKATKKQSLTLPLKNAFFDLHLSAFEWLSDSNGIQDPNHLVRKRSFNHLAKLFEFLLQTK